MAHAAWRTAVRVAQARALAAGRRPATCLAGSATASALATAAAVPSRAFAASAAAAWRPATGGTHTPPRLAETPVVDRVRGVQADVVRTNKQIADASRCSEVLDIYATRTHDFNNVNFATSVNRLQRSVRHIFQHQRASLCRPCGTVHTRTCAPMSRRANLQVRSVGSGTRL